MGDEITQDIVRGWNNRLSCGTHMKMPSTTCQNFTTVTAEVKVQWTIWYCDRSGNVRTEIVFDNGRTVKIYHVGRQVTETKVERKEMLGSVTSWAYKRFLIDTSGRWSC